MHTPSVRLFTRGRKDLCPLLKCHKNPQVCCSMISLDRQFRVRGSSPIQVRWRFSERGSEVCSIQSCLSVLLRSECFQCTRHRLFKISCIDVKVWNIILNKVSNLTKTPSSISNLHVYNIFLVGKMNYACIKHIFICVFLFTTCFGVYTCRRICHHDSSLSPSKKNGFLLDSDLHSLYNDSHPGPSVFLD